MSLILEALRRADAERGRGAVPGLHTPQAVTPAAPPVAPSRLWLWIPVVLAFTAVAGITLGWWWQLRDTATQERVVLAPTTVAPAASPLAAAASPSVQHDADNTVTAPAAAAQAIPEPAAAATRQAASDAKSVVTAPADTSRAGTPANATVSLAPLTPRDAAPPARVAATFAPTAAASTPRDTGLPAAQVRLLQDLPAATRQQLPQLAVSGASYSANPAWRMVIVNGQVLHEGDEAANGVVLESIAPRQVVLRGRGQRWAVAY